MIASQLSLLIYFALIQPYAYHFTANLLRLSSISHPGPELVP